MSPRKPEKPRATYYLAYGKSHETHLFYAWQRPRDRSIDRWKTREKWPCLVIDRHFGFSEQRYLVPSAVESFATLDRHPQRCTQSKTYMVARQSEASCSPRIPPCHVSGELSKVPNFAPSVLCFSQVSGGLILRHHLSRQHP